VLPAKLYQSVRNGTGFGFASVVCVRQVRECFLKHGHCGGWAVVDVVLQPAGVGWINVTMNIHQAHREESNVSEKGRLGWLLLL
jgi:hypothetical protein